MTTNDQKNNAEKQMQLARQMEQQTIRVLLLGPGCSGKTTILKQIKKIHCRDGISEREQLNDRQKITKSIQDAVVEYMRILCVEAPKLNIQYNTNTIVSDSYEHIRKEFELLHPENPRPLTEDVAAKIAMLWEDPGIKATLAARQHFQIADNVSYFFDRIGTISQISYVPSFDDYVRFRHRSAGSSKTKIQIDISTFGKHTFEFTDVVGQKSERQKWMKFLGEAQGVNAVLYILAISDYDLTLYEDNKTNRLKDAIDLFKKIVTSQSSDFFENKTLMLFFNKYDLFLEKIKDVPITTTFDDFPETFNPNGEVDVVRFVAAKFLKVLEEGNIKLGGPLHIVRSTALDTNNIEKIFGDITLDLVHQNLRQLNLIR